MVLLLRFIDFDEKSRESAHMWAFNLKRCHFDLKKLIHEHSIWFLIIIFVICTSVYMISFFIFASCFKTSDSTNYGDASTFATGLVSCLAITGGVFAVYLQHLELSLQRKELKSTRIELHNQKEEITKQTSIFKEDQFAQSFFNMFQIYKNCIANLHGVVFVLGKNVDYQSIEYLSCKLNSLQSFLAADSMAIEQNIKKHTSLFCESYSLFLAIVFLIDNSYLNYKQKLFYYSILQKVSLLEIIWLALYAVTHNKEEFNLLERNNLFDNLKTYLKHNSEENPLNQPDSHWFDIFGFLEDCFGIKKKVDSMIIFLGADGD